MTESLNTQSAAPRSNKIFYWVYSLALLPVLIFRIMIWVGQNKEVVSPNLPDWSSFALLSAPFYLIMLIASYKQDQRNGSYLGTFAIILAWLLDWWLFDFPPAFFLGFHATVYVCAIFGPKQFAKFVEHYDEPLENLSDAEKNIKLINEYSKKINDTKEAKFFAGTFVAAGLLSCAFNFTMAVEEYEAEVAATDYHQLWESKGNAYSVGYRSMSVGSSVQKCTMNIGKPEAYIQVFYDAYGKQRARIMSNGEPMRGNNIIMFDGDQRTMDTRFTTGDRAAYLDDGELHKLALEKGNFLQIFAEHPKTKKLLHSQIAVKRDFLDAESRFYLCVIQR